MGQAAESKAVSGDQSPRTNVQQSSSIRTILVHQMIPPLARAAVGPPPPTPTPTPASSTCTDENQAPAPKWNEARLARSAYSCPLSRKTLLATRPREAFQEEEAMGQAAESKAVSGDLSSVSSTIAFLVVLQIVLSRPRSLLFCCPLLYAQQRHHISCPLWVYSPKPHVLWHKLHEFSAAFWGLIFDGRIDWGCRLNGVGGWRSSQPQPRFWIFYHKPERWKRTRSKLTRPN